MSSLADLLKGCGLDAVIRMPRKEFVKEHTHLVNVLTKGTPKQRRTEAKKQLKELKGGAFRVVSGAAGDGWFVMDGVRRVAGPFPTEAEAEERMRGMSPSRPVREEEPPRAPQRPPPRRPVGLAPRPIAPIEFEEEEKKEEESEEEEGVRTPPKKKSRGGALEGGAYVIRKDNDVYKVKTGKRVLGTFGTFKEAQRFVRTLRMGKKLTTKDDEGYSSEVAEAFGVEGKGKEGRTRRETDAVKGLDKRIRLEDRVFRAFEPHLKTEKDKEAFKLMISNTEDDILKSMLKVDFVEGSGRAAGFIRRMMAETKRKNKGKYRNPTKPLPEDTTMNAPVAFDYFSMPKESRAMSKHIMDHFFRIRPYNATERNQLNDYEKELVASRRRGGTKKSGFVQRQIAEGKTDSLSGVKNPSANLKSKMSKTPKKESTETSPKMPKEGSKTTRMAIGEDHRGRDIYGYGVVYKVLDDESKRVAVEFYYDDGNTSDMRGVYQYTNENKVRLRYDMDYSINVSLDETKEKLSSIVFNKSDL